MNSEQLLKQAEKAAREIRAENRFASLWQRFVAWRRERMCRKGKHYFVRRTQIGHGRIWQEGCKFPVGAYKDFQCYCRTCGKVMTYRTTT